MGTPLASSLKLGWVSVRRLLWRSDPHFHFSVILPPPLPFLRNGSFLSRTLDTMEILNIRSGRVALALVIFLFLGSLVLLDRL